MAKPTRTHRGTTTGRYMSAEQTGRYTKPIPKETRRSPRWFGFVVVAMLFAGAGVVVLNYLSVLPGSTNSWYLVAGLALCTAGFVLAMRLK